MDWYIFCKNYIEWGIATTESLKIYVVKGKITEAQYKEITEIDYVAIVA